MTLQLRPLSSLAKVLPRRIVGKKTVSAEVALGQEISFQTAFRLRGEPTERYERRSFQIRITSPLEESIRLWRVKNIPVTLAAYPDRKDDGYISTDSGLYPDVLCPLEQGRVPAMTDLWNALWISLRIPEDTRAGVYPIRISFWSEGREWGSVTFRLTVHSVALPPQKLLFTQWFHCDCIAEVHRVKIFSEAHWALMEKYMRLAAEHGMNTVLTPVLTPPLDTEVGEERPTVQLVEILREGDRYTFDFSRLGRYVRMAREAGLHTFEINHFFTQWGAAYAPKVVAAVNGRQTRIFGWETSAVCEEYKSFLGQLIPALISYLESLGVTREHILFHVSDEPHREHLEQYRASAAVLLPLIRGCRHMDALSDLDFYREGLVELPVVASNRIKPYLEAKVPDLWCYYCCSQGVEVSNRFLAMPSSRNRILGVQMYKYGIAGFLHWGYNFYYDRHSEHLIDPYRTADGDGSWPAGDPFSVYPHGDEVIPSLRLKVFGNALEDIRLLELLEQKLGREAVIEGLDRLCGEPLTFFTYPREESFFAALYAWIFRELA